MSETTSEATREHDFNIQIDRANYTVHQLEMTGTELRNVPKPSVPSDRDLYEVRPGQPDRLIENVTIVDIRDGLRFFTAPHHINPGSSR